MYSYSMTPQTTTHLQCTLGSIHRLPLLSPLRFLLFGGEKVTHPRLGEDLKHTRIQQAGKAWAIRILSWYCQALWDGSCKNQR